MNPLAPSLEQLGHRMLRQPVDLQVRLQFSQLIGDGNVALRMAEANRRRDVQRSPTARHRAPPGADLARALDEFADKQVNLDRIAGIWRMCGSVQGDHRSAGSL